jgi:hypothetical protein
MKIRFISIVVIFLIQPLLCQAQDVLSVKGRRAIVSFDPTLHSVQIGQEYPTQRSPGATVQVQEIGERFLLTILVEGRLREDDLIDFTVASQLKNEANAPFRPHHVGLGLAVVNHGAISLDGEQFFEAAGVSGLMFSYRYHRNKTWDFGFKITRKSGTTLIGDDLLFNYQASGSIRNLSEEFESKLQKTMVTARRNLWNALYLDLGLGVTTYTLEGEFTDTNNIVNPMKSTFRGVDVDAHLGYQVKFQHRYFLEASIGASFSFLGSSNIDNPYAQPELEIEGSARAFNTGYQLSAGICF